MVHLCCTQRSSYKSIVGVLQVFIVDFITYWLSFDARRSPLDLALEHPHLSTTAREGICWFIRRGWVRNSQFESWFVIVKGESRSDIYSDIICYLNSEYYWLLPCSETFCLLGSSCSIDCSQRRLSLGIISVYTLVRIIITHTCHNF